ncbi:MAG TPA: InlB B-repeat-containing protein, partial [Clostridia bacterium]|nr:InlB B-repeat-containing protein [Clostridia bacterium]
FSNTQVKWFKKGVTYLLSFAMIVGILAFVLEPIEAEASHTANCRVIVHTKDKWLAGTSRTLYLRAMSGTTIVYNVKLAGGYAQNDTDTTDFKITPGSSKELSDIDGWVLYMSDEGGSFGEGWDCDWVRCYYYPNGIALPTTDNSAGAGYTQIISHEDDFTISGKGKSQTLTESTWKFRGNNHQLTFNSNNGSTNNVFKAVEGATIDKTYSTYYTTNPTKTGYTFNGWSPVLPTYGPAANTTYIAQWTVSKYKVNFDAKGGSAVSSITQNYNTSVTKPADPTKDGHTFAGWYTDVGLTNSVSWPYILGMANVTFYAKWTVNSYNITFDANFGTGGTGPNSMLYGATLTAPTVTRTGHEFASWSPTVHPTVPASDQTYTAQWTLNTYTITWAANGGTGGGTNSCNHGDTPTAIDAGTRVGYTFTGWDPMIGAANGATTYTAQWSISNVNITFDANGGTGGTVATSMQVGASLTAPTLTKEGFVLGGWLPALPATVPAVDTIYVAQWVQTAVNVTKTQDGMVVNIRGWTADSQYQIWSYQQVQSDDLLASDTNVQANQWILAKSYAAGNTGIVQGDGSINFTVPNFLSSTANYVMAVRIADANNNFVAEIRDAYTPDDVGEAVITKILVDNVVTTGYELREIKGGAEMLIQVIGNDVPNITYTATILSGATSMPLNMGGNELNWNISALEPGLYTVEFTATNGDTTATQLMTFELFALAAVTNYGILNNMQLNPAAGGVDITPDFANGSFSFRLREPGRAPQFRSREYAASETIAHPITAPGIYHVNGYVTRAGLIGTENGGFDDGIIRTVVIPRTGQASGPVTMNLTANQTLPNVAKGTPIVFTAAATGLPEPVQYSFWRYDATGYVLVKDWSTSDTLNWTPARIGEYNIEARAKGAGAGSYEIKRSLTVNITGAESKANITAITLNTDELMGLQARKPIMLKANAVSADQDLLYKFYVYDGDMLNSQLKGYTVDQNCVWTPRKAGMTYTISVLVKNQASFGKYDAIESFEVTVPAED